MSFNFLGEGQFSKVHKVKRLKDSRLYALKKVKVLGMSDKDKFNVLNEVRLLYSVQSHNVVSYKDAFIDPNSGHLCIVTEFADGGDLARHIRQNVQNGTNFSEY